MKPGYSFSSISCQHGVGAVFLLGHQRGIDPGVDDVAEQVLDDGVRLRDDADAPMVFVDQAGDDRRPR